MSELKLSIEEQVKIMRGQLAAFDTLLEKLQYMNVFFDSDPVFSKEARDIVRADLVCTIKSIRNESNSL